ncbi:MAG: glycosyltransferase family 4 protein [Cytophagaceae bacterium]
MKIAFFSHKPFSEKLGATKNRIELANGLSKLGWKVELIDKNRYFPLNENANSFAYCEALKEYLIKNSSQFDVVLYEYHSLPFDRKLFSQNTLFVARPALLHYHLQNIVVPDTFKNKLSSFKNKVFKFLGFGEEKAFKNKDAVAEYSLQQCDLIQVQNALDKDILIKNGFNRDKIVIIPNGISDERIKLFTNINRNYDSLFTIAFVGTFDFRKGALDFPHIFRNILKAYPKTQFKLLGTKGLFPSKSEVLAFFPQKYHSIISVIPTFEPNELPGLLQDCHIGIFPSYHESFGFGALEMMCAGLPVISYNTPGPSDFILKELLVPIGDKNGISEKVLELMADKELLSQKSRIARQVAKEYNWSSIASVASENYLKYFKGLK